MKRLILTILTVLTLLAIGAIPASATNAPPPLSVAAGVAPPEIAAAVKAQATPTFSNFVPGNQTGVAPGTRTISVQATSSQVLVDFSLTLDGVPLQTRTFGAGTTSATITATAFITINPHRVVATATNASGEVGTAKWAFVGVGTTAIIRCFGETAHCIAFGFKTFWEQNGGLAIFGFPITEEFQEQNPPPPLGDGQVHTVQYFERQRFEFHPEFPVQFRVLGGLLGRRVADITGVSSNPAFQPVGRNPLAACRFFPETGHNSCFTFRQFWEANGGLRTFGFPISEDFTQVLPPPPLGDGQAHIVQYYERARFEFYPNNPVAFRIQLGLLGRIVVPPDRLPLDP